jgi:uncharacterized protein YydD (DUF2326 family)
MQISRIYSNVPRVFCPIDFHSGEDSARLNVIYGAVRHPKDQRKDSHNLGKSTLIQLIDFLLLKGVSSGHFLMRHQDRFKEFVFFLEIALNSGDFATVRRAATDANKIALKRHVEAKQDLAKAEDDAWDHVNMSREDALRLLDGWLDLRILKPYDFRKAITYFLRAQGDYRDELQLQKFATGKDRDWKPFVAHLFGFNETPVHQKYDLDDTIERLKQRQADLQATVQFSEEQLPELGARIGVLQQQVKEVEASIDAFSFDAEERHIMRELVDTIENEIAETNDQLYNIRYDIRQIDAAFEHKDKFDLKEIEEIFNEAEVHFPRGLKKSYEELVTFNRKVTQERHAALRARRKTLAQQEGELALRKISLDERRESELRVLRSTDTFEKFKELQKALSHRQAELVYLEGQRKQLELVAEVARRVREAERERGRVVDEIKAMVTRPSAIFDRFSATFNGYCQRVLNHDGIFFFRVNSNNNFDYQIGLSLPGQSAATSSLSEGTSYKKLLCALFDLALLKVYEDMPFFHFVVHDGIFEALDDRKKLALLGVIRDQVKGKKTQYILTLIDSDMPRGPNGSKVEFEEDEVILRLHDDGNDGRLFKMAEF